MPAHEPERRLIHGDFGSANVIADGASITAVIDWDLAAVGDPLYDVANCCSGARRGSPRSATQLRRRHAAERRTLACYQLRIGVEEVHHVVVGGDAVDLGLAAGAATHAGGRGGRLAASAGLL